jgi:hypothetical protein
MDHIGHSYKKKIMRVQVDPQTAPRTLYWGERRITILEVIDQWYGPRYRYVKVPPAPAMFSMKNC